VGEPPPPEGGGVISPERYGGRVAGVASYGALGHVPPSTFNNFILVHFGVNLTANYPSIVQCARLADVQMSTTHSSFDQYCITHKTIRYRAAAAPGPEVHRECP